MANGDDAGVAPFCVICRRSSDVKWRKHIFTNAHQRAASEFLLTRVRRLETKWQQLRDGDSTDEIREYCPFCEQDIVGAEPLVQHVASPSHRTQVHAFCKHHRCDAKQELRARLWLRASEYHELLKRLQESETKSVPSASETTTTFSKPLEQEFLSSAVSQLERVRSAPDVTRAPATAAAADTSLASLLGPRVDPRIKTRTLTSPEGIRQNPLGVHDGVRVWGGGIVKVRKAEWLPWGIDLLVTAELERQLGSSTMLSAGADAGAGAATYRVTERAQALGLATVPRVAWGDSVANVHSVAAVPPWMVATEDEYRSRNQRVATAEPTDDIFARMASAYDDKTWLPNFGSVWQDGPRAKTRAAFQQLSKRPRGTTNNVSLRAREPRSSSVSHDSFQRESIRSEAIAAPRSEPSPSTPSAPRSLSVAPPPAPPVPAASSAPSIDPVCASAPPLSELDVKKQALLAQKERLRAKLAAKRKKT